MMTLTENEINIAKKLLIDDELVAIPTETVYGLAGNAFSEVAVKKIFALKNRPSFNPLIVHIGNIDQLELVAKNIPPLALKLAQTFWPGPLTLLLEKKEIVPNCVTAGKMTVAVRIPDHPITLKLLAQLSFPVAAPSANPFMSVSPTNPEHVKNYFGDKLPYTLDGGKCVKGIESTIIGFKEGRAVLYRAGSCSQEEIEKITGKLLLPKSITDTPEAPGMLKRHYSPKTLLVLTDDYKKNLAKYSHLKVGVLTFMPTQVQSDNVVYRYLSETNSLAQAASQLYATLIELDKLNLDIIIAVLMPDEGLGRTINDRLQRAATLG